MLSPRFRRTTKRAGHIRWGTGSLSAVYIVVASLLFSLDVIAEEPVVIAADEWCPYNCALNASPPGYVIEIARAAWTTPTRRVEYRVIPWSRTLMMVREGAIDGVIGTTAAEMKGMIGSKRPFGYTANGVAIRRGTVFRLETPENLNGYRVGIILDYQYGNLLDAYLKRRLKGMDLHVATGDAALRQNLRMLTQGRLDLVLEDINVLAWTLRQAEWSNLTLAPGIIGFEPLYIGLSPRKARSIELYEAFDATLMAMIADGRLVHILATYGLTLASIGLGPPDPLPERAQQQ